MRKDVEKLYEYMRTKAADLGIALSEVQLQRFLSYYTLLEETNEKINLTAVTGPEEVATRHFFDSLAPIMLEETGELIKKPQIQMLDMGTGAGFPGMPLAIALPHTKVVLADSLHKRTEFLRMVAAETDTGNVAILTGRAEELAKEESLRETFDVVVSRAVADLQVLCEYCLPFVKTGGAFIAWKGPAAQEEMRRAENAIDTLGGKRPKIYHYLLPGTEAQRCLVIIEKELKTPLKYPRRSGIPAKRPL